MPSEVLDYFREKDARFKNVSDADLKAYIKEKYPEFSKDLAPQPLLGTAKKAAARKLGIEVGQHAATMESEIGTAKGKAVGEMAAGATLGAATLATGGLATGPAMALMGSAGLLAGTEKELAKSYFGSGEVPQSGAELAKNLGLEAVLSAAGEGGGRVIGQGLKYLGAEKIPSLMMRSAAKSQEGQIVLKRIQQNHFDQLRDFVRLRGNPKIDIGSDLQKFYNAVGKRATGTSEAFDAAMKPINAKLGIGGGGTFSKQPLDVLMEVKSDLSHVTYKLKGMNTDEFVALENLTKAVDSKINESLGLLGGPHARRVYRNFKAFTEQIKKDDAALDGVRDGIKKVLGKAAGYVPGVDAAIDGIIREKAAPFALEHIYSNPKTAAMIQKAVQLQIDGKYGQAQLAFEAAINTSQVGTLLKDWMKPEKRATILQGLSQTMANFVPPSIGP